VNSEVQPISRDFCAVEFRHSQADISKARYLLGYAPTNHLADGIAQEIPWCVEQNDF